MKLPKTLYVKREDDGNEYYFVATEKMRELVTDINDTLNVGTYQLTETNEVDTLLRIRGGKKKEK